MGSDGFPMVLKVLDGLGHLTTCFYMFQFLNIYMYGF